MALVADIEKQRDLLRFLWFTNVPQNDFSIQRLRFTRVLFGAAPSQYILNAVIRKHAEKYQEVDPRYEKMVKLGFYVDDLNTSVKGFTEGVDFYTKCKTRFAEAGFNVRKWRSNDPHLKRVFDEREEIFENLETGKVLGITWNEGSDQLVVRLADFLPEIESLDKVTKRTILKVMAGFYDPPGWIQPAVIKLKIIFQEAWKSNFDWDD